MLSSVSVDADEIEVDENQARGLAYWASSLLLQGRVMPSSAVDVGRYAADADNLMLEAKKILSVHTSPMPGWRRPFRGWSLGSVR